jgi:hypothetical protein
MGIKPVGDLDPQIFAAPFEGWTWQVLATPVDESRLELESLTRVEVVIRHQDPPLVHRLAEILRSEDLSTQALANREAPTTLP